MVAIRNMVKLIRMLLLQFNRFHSYKIVISCEIGAKFAKTLNLEYITLNSLLT